MKLLVSALLDSLLSTGPTLHLASHCSCQHIMFWIFSFCLFSLSDKSRPKEWEPLLGVMWPNQHRHHHSQQSLPPASVPDNKGDSKLVSGLAEGCDPLAGGRTYLHHEHDGRQSQRAAAASSSRRSAGDHCIWPQGQQSAVELRKGRLVTFISQSDSIC